MTQPRNVAGMWCTEVLEKLDAYMDDELPAEAKQQVEAHLSGCDWCERFGGRYAQTVQLLRDDVPDKTAENVDLIIDAALQKIEQST